MNQLDFSEDFFRRESARLVGFLTTRFGLQRLQFAEDVAQETLVRAMQTWPYRGMPDNPSAWLTQTAKNVSIDLLRREQNWRDKESDIAAEHSRWLADPVEETHEETFADDTLRMIFVCFHPQLSTEAQTALALRTICGLSPAEIAAAFLTSEAAISKRLVRARQRIRELALPFSVPDLEELSFRLEGVLGTIYLLFNEGYKASSGESLVRSDLCQEAIRLVSLLAEHPTTRTPRTLALLALMLLNAARLSSRTDEAGNLLRLHEQDRLVWDRSMIERGVRCLALAGKGNELSPYHLEAGIAACHCLAKDKDSTDWSRILRLYDQLLSLVDSPITRLNRSVALAQVHGAEAGLLSMKNLPLESFYLLHAVRGTFEIERNNLNAAKIHFCKALDLAQLPSERRFLISRITECEVAARR
ncbi:DNA-directed RNA polymerase sigma-70 factor [Oceaniferula spumae]|uniref:DNA-directed RNA polymerase sigma-70 factor n=1 Tax=Oceaniferula spumae TaxID=2979115 RepID=A0AAT9FJN5_9BACT